MRSQDEVQHAHDILWGQVTGNDERVLPEEDIKFAQAALDVLCWVLEHNHPNGFPENVKGIEKELVKRGYKITKLPFPMNPRQIGGDM